MFANTTLCVMNLAFPDVCNTPTPAGPVPIPYPNIALSVTHIPSQFHIFIGGGLAENLLTQGTISNGDNAGLLGGVVSGMDMSSDRCFLGSFKVALGGVFGTRLTSPTGQNGSMPNSVGLSITPSQFCVMLLG